MARISSPQKFSQLNASFELSPALRISFGWMKMNLNMINVHFVVQQKMSERWAGVGYIYYDSDSFVRCCRCCSTKMKMGSKLRGFPFLLLFHSVRAARPPARECFLQTNVKCELRWGVLNSGIFADISPGVTGTVFFVSRNILSEAAEYIARNPRNSFPQKSANSQPALKLILPAVNWNWSPEIFKAVVGIQKSNHNFVPS